jgi:hypothetical protein
MWGCTPTRTRRSPLNERVRRWPSCRPGHRSLLLHSGSGLSARFVDPRRRCWRKGLVMCPHKPARRCPAAASTSGAPTGLFRVRAWSLPGTARWAHVPIAAVEDRRRAGLVELLSNNPTIEIVGQALTRGEAVERARRHAPVSASRRRRRSSGGASQPSRRRGPDRAGGHAAGPRQALQRHEAGAVSGRALCASSTLATDNVVWTPAAGVDDYPGGP